MINLFGVKITRSEAEDKLAASHIDLNNILALSRAGHYVTYAPDAQKLVETERK